MLVPASHGAQVALFPAHAHAHMGPRLDLHRSRFPRLPLMPLRSHTHVRVPSSCKQVAVADGSHYNIQTSDLLLQHLDEIFATYI
jgi:hypothetical protein